MQEELKCNNPQMIETVLSIIEKIKNLPEETETSISNLTDKDKNNDLEFMFEVNNIVENVCQKLNITLDYSKVKGLIIGYPFNAPFIKRTVQPKNNNIENKKEYIGNGNFYRVQSLLNKKQ